MTTDDIQHNRLMIIKNRETFIQEHKQNYSDW